MSFKLDISTLYIITIIFCSLIYFAIPIGGLAIPVYFIVVCVFLTYCFIKSPNEFLRKIISFFQTSYGKLLGLAIIFIFMGIIFSIFKGTFILSKIFTNFFGEFFCSILFPMFATIIAVPKMIENRLIYKFLLWFYFGIFILGVIDFIGMMFDIQIIIDFFDFIINRWAIVSGKPRGGDFANGLPRTESIFTEPSPFAYFILISSPIIYCLSHSKFKILKNRITDVVIKKIVYILMFFNLITTQSPIFLVFFSILTACYIIYKMQKWGKNTWVKFIIALFCIILAFLILYLLNPEFANKVDVTTTYLNRIIITVQNFNNIGGMMSAEASLGTRICNLTSLFFVFLKHPFFGVGYGNINSVWANVVLNLPFPITPEIYGNALTGKFGGGGVAFSLKMLAETGLFSTLCIYLFFLRLIYLITKKIKYFSFENQGLLNCLKYSLIIFILTSWYDSVFMLPINFFYIGLIVAFFNYGKKHSAVVINKIRSEHFEK